jgi:hypothetical protein
MTTDLGTFAYDASITVGDPGAAAVALDVPTSHASMALTNIEGVDLTADITALAAGDALLVARAGVPEVWVAYTVTDLATMYADWCTVPVRLAATSPVDVPQRTDTVALTWATAVEVGAPTFTFGMGSILTTTPAGKPPVGTDLAKWLSINAADSTTLALLDVCCAAAVQYELGRLSTARMVDAGYAPPDVLPGTVAHAMLMRAAAVYRRRNSVNGFEGFADIGAVAIRSSDPDIERLVDPWRAWAFA